MNTRQSVYPKRVLMCAPSAFDVVHEHNPHQARMRQAGTSVDHAKACRQWDRLVSILRGLGVRVEVIHPAPNLPDMVFAANAGFVRNGSVVLSRFRHNERNGEIALFRNHFLYALKYQVVQLPPCLPIDNSPLFFEGEGDIVRHQGDLFGGYGLRSNRGGIRAAGATPAFRLVEEAFFHLDTCMASVAGAILWYPPAFFQATHIRNHTQNRTVSDEDAHNFALNGIPVRTEEGWHFVTSPASRPFRDTLASFGVTVHENNVSEFMKAGGGNKCLVLFLE